MLGSLALWACSEARKAPEPRPAAEQPSESAQTAASAFFEPDPGARDALCEGSVRANLGAHISVRLWAPESLPRERIIRHTRALATSLRHLGIEFTSAGAVQPMAEKALFVGAGAAKNAGTEPLSREAREARLAPIITAPLRRALENLAPASEREVQVIFVDTIATRDSPISVGLRHPAGLTLSPLAAANEEAAPLAALLGMPLSALPAPVILLSMHELAKMPPELRQSTLAHEMGHAFGLPHGGGRDNLMSPQRHARCRPGLQAEQVAIWRANLASDPT